MGGDYYERDVITSSHAFSEESQKIICGNIQGHSSLNPKRWEDEPLINTHKNPIVFALDDTGSMGDWTKVVYDKLPMFYGQIMIQKYLDDPSISFAAIGDHTCCTAPLQVSEFGAGVELDQMISKLYMEGNGGGNEHESYELAAYFYLNNVKLGVCEYPFFFITGDEGHFDKLSPDTVKTWLNLPCNDTVDSKDLFRLLMKKYNVFHIKKPYISKNYEMKIRSQWESTLGAERVFVFNEPKAVIDIVLGLIAITSKARKLNDYLDDMKQRGQSNERIGLVKDLLSDYYKMFEEGKVEVIKTSS